jgi:hypothetical protein
MKRRRALPIAAFACCVGVAAPASGLPTHHANQRHSCTSPKGAKVIAKDPRAVIVRVDRPQRHGEVLITHEWRYCVRRTGRFTHLVQQASYHDGFGNVVEVRGVVLAGDYAAYATQTTPHGGRYNALPMGTVSVRDLVHGRTRTDHLSRAGTCDIFSLRVASDATAAWILAPCPIADPVTTQQTWVVQAVDSSGRSITLDSATVAITSTNPFANLQLSCQANCRPGRTAFAFWTDTGVDRALTVP